MRRRIGFHILLPSIVSTVVLLGALLAGCGDDTATSISTSPEATTRTIVQSGAIPTSLLEPDMVFPDVDAVIVGEVVEVLPFRSNPLADRYAKGADDVSAPLPVIYRGAVVETEKSFGPEKTAQRITVWYLSSGEFSEKDEVI